MRPITALAILPFTLLLACGPKPPPEDPTGGDGKNEAQKTSDTQTQIAEQQQREYMVEQYTTLINKVNEAIDALDDETLYSLMTQETQEMFSVLAQMDMYVANIQNVAPPDHVVQQQKDFNVVYTLEDIDTETGTATLVGVMRDSGNEVRFPISFAQKQEAYLFDYTEVLSKRVKNMTKVILVQLLARLNQAVEDQDLEAFESVFAPGSLESCPDPFGLASDTGHSDLGTKELLQEIKEKKIVMGEPQVNTPDPLGTVPYTAGETASTIKVTLVLEKGRAYLDASGNCDPLGGK